MRAALAGMALVVTMALGGCVHAGHDMAAMHQLGAQHDCERMHQQRHADGEACECCEHEAGATQREHCDHAHGEHHGAEAHQQH